MKITCPTCGTEFPIEAGLLEDDGKRLGAILADLDPPLARAALSYLRLFKPVKTALRTARAIKVLQELLTLIRAGKVARDERNGLYRSTTAAMWIAGIEQMIHAVAVLDLPLSSHVYLRKVVYGIADSADAVAEKQRDKDLRSGQRPIDDKQGAPKTLEGELNTLRIRRELGRISQAAHDQAEAEIRQRYVGSGDGTP